MTLGLQLIYNKDSTFKFNKRLKTVSQEIVMTLIKMTSIDTNNR